MLANEVTLERFDATPEELHCSSIVTEILVHHSQVHIRDNLNADLSSSLSEGAGPLGRLESVVIVAH